MKICSLYGAGFYYMPGTDTCIKFGGYLRADTVFNTNADYAGANGAPAGAHNRDSNYFTTRSRMDFTVDTRSATQYGVLRTFADMVFSWTGGGYTGSNPTTYGGGEGIGGANLGLYHAFIQFAGFTLGRTVSIFDTPWQSYPAGGPDNIPGGSNHVTGVNQLTYTGDFGQGITASVSLQDPTAYDQSNVWNLTGASAAGLITGAYGVSNVAGTRAPDITGQVRVDQAWGLFQFSVAAHDNHVAYYGATEPTGHPDDKWGFAVQAALSIKNIPTGPGDSINLQGVYTDGATRYNFHSLFPQTVTMFGGTGLGGVYQSLGIAGLADAVYTGTSTADGSSLETVRTWGFRGGYTHNWNPNWASAIYGGYAGLRYGNSGKATICTNMVGMLGLTGNCNPDFNFAVVGGNVIWTPLKDLAFTVDVNWAHLDQKFSGTIAGTPPAAYAKPTALYELKNQDTVSVLVRAQRNL